MSGNRRKDDLEQRGGVAARALAASIFREEIDFNDPAAPFPTDQIAVAKLEASIRPHRISTVAARPESFESRLRCFARRAKRSDAEIEREAHNAIGSRLGGAEPRFFRKVPAARLRSFDDALLAQVVGNFVDWDPLLRQLETNGETDAVRDAMTRTVNALRARGIARETAEDGLQTALLVAIETKDDPFHGYVYESPWPAWLIRTALNIVLGMRDGEPEDPEEPSVVPDPFASEDLRRWKERHELVLATFENDDVRERAEEIIRARIRQDAADDSELAQRITDKTGKPCTRNMVYLTRMSYLARMEVFRYLDAQSDRSLLEWIQFGHQREIPNMKMLEASARAAQPEGTLAWALLSFTVFGSDAYRARWMPVARRMLRRPNPDYDARYAKWTSEPKSKAAHTLHNRAKQKGLGWAIPACWHLRVLRLETADRIAATLRCPQCADLAAAM